MAAAAPTPPHRAFAGLHVQLQELIYGRAILPDLSTSTRTMERMITRGFSLDASQIALLYATSCKHILPHRSYNTCFHSFNTRMWMQDTSQDPTTCVCIVQRSLSGAMQRARIVCALFQMR